MRFAVLCGVLWRWLHCCMGATPGIGCWTRIYDADHLAKHEAKTSRRRRVDPS